MPSLPSSRGPGLAAAFLASLLFAGCEKPGGGHEHAAEEEVKTAQVTVWGERFEIFLEHRVLVAGTPTRFVTHVTDRQTLEPRTEGPMTFLVAKAGEAPKRILDPAPARAGIYIPELTFATAGEWSVNLEIPLDGEPHLVTLPTFRVFASEADARKAPEEEAPEGISFLKEQAWKIKVRVEPAAKRAVSERIRVPAHVAAHPRGRAIVAPPLAGKLATAPGQPLPSVGDRVEAGQVLALVQPALAGSDLLSLAGNRQQQISLGQQTEALVFQIETMKVELAVKVAETDAGAIRARVAREQAARILERVRALHAENARSERELQEAEFALRAADADLEAAEALKRAYQDAMERLGSRAVRQPPIPGDEIAGGYPPVELRAPISGTVVAVGGTVGEHLPVERAVFTLLDPSRVRIEARIPEADLGKVRPPYRALLERPDARGEFAPLGPDGGGAVVFHSPEVDVASRTVALVYEVPNPEGKLRIGMAVTVHLETGQVDDAVAIPLSAVVEEDGRPIVFVQVSGETFQKRDVALGLRDGAFVQVLSGLEAGEMTVTLGAYAIRLASVSTSIPAHGHAH